MKKCSRCGCEKDDSEFIDRGITFATCEKCRIQKAKYYAKKSGQKTIIKEKAKEKDFERLRKYGFKLWYEESPIYELD